jgi:hypothetical protein
MQRLLHRVLAARLSNYASLFSSQRGFTEMDGTLANTMILHEYLDECSEVKHIPSCLWMSGRHLTQCHTVLSPGHWVVSEFQTRYTNTLWPLLTPLHPLIVIFVLIALKATLPTSNARSETSASRSTRM